MQPDKPSTREIARLVTFYQKNIRNDGKVVGIIRQIQLLLSKGLTLGDISQAMQNYLASPFNQGKDERLRPHIRGFMKMESIQRWQTPITNDAAMVGLHRLQHAAVDVPPTPIHPPVDVEIDEPVEI